MSSFDADLHAMIWKWETLAEILALVSSEHQVVKELSRRSIFSQCEDAAYVERFSPTFTRSSVNTKGVFRRSN